MTRHPFDRKSLDVATAGLLTTIAFATGAAAHDVTRVSLKTSGAEAASESRGCFVSADGSCVAFETTDALDPADTNLKRDIYVHDSATGVVQLVSLTSAGGLANGDSFAPTLSEDGTVVVFHSSATNLVAGDGNLVADVFLHDRTTGKTRRISLDTLGLDADAESYSPSIDAHARYVAFESKAGDLITADTNLVTDVFVWDRTTGAIVRASETSGGGQFLGDSAHPRISGDGRFVVFDSGEVVDPADVNGARDVFVKDLVSGVLSYVSVDPVGLPGDGLSEYPTLTRHGRYVCFSSLATDLVPFDFNSIRDLFVRDLATGVTTRIALTRDGLEAGADYGSIAQDGQFVAFYGSFNLSPSDRHPAATDVYVWDLAGNLPILVSQPYDGGVQDGVLYGPGFPSISADGQAVAFESDATNMVSGDGNGVIDVFVRRQISTVRATSVLAGTGRAGTFGVPSIAINFDPILGAQIDISVGNSLGLPTPSLVYMGVTGFPLTIPLFFGMLPPAGLVVSSEVPTDPTMAGLGVFVQAIETDPGALFGASRTQHLNLLFGN